MRVEENRWQNRTYYSNRHYWVIFPLSLCLFSFFFILVDFFFGGREWFFHGKWVLWDGFVLFFFKTCFFYYCDFSCISKGFDDDDEEEWIIQHLDWDLSSQWSEPHCFWISPPLFYLIFFLIWCYLNMFRWLPTN